jgi:hypothetical protein
VIERPVFIVAPPRSGGTAGQPRNALRVPFLAAVTPDSQFVYIHRERSDAATNSFVLPEAQPAAG